MEVGTAKESHPVRAVNRACGPFLLLLVASCAGGPGGAPEPGARADDLLLLNRVTWGANPSSARALARMGPASYLEAQLQPAQEAALPPEVQALPAQRRREEGGAAGVPAGAHAPWTRGGRAHAAARPVLTVAAARADDLVLDEPLQRLPVQGEPAGAGGGLRGARHPAARARALPRAARRDRAAPGDAHLPGQRAERRQPDQRELCARADGAAHARRG